MKRIWLVPFVITILMLSGCGFVKGEKVIHKRDELISKQFEALCYERDYGTVYIELDDQDVADEIVKYTDNVWKKLDLGEMENKMEIYLVKNINTLLVDALDEGVIILNYDRTSAEKACVAQELIYHYFDCDYWVAYGLARNSEDVNIENITKYFMSSDDMELPIFATYFFDTFQNEELCKITKDLAVSITKYLMKSGKSAKQIIEESRNTKEMLSGWVNQEGLEDKLRISQYTEERIKFYDLNGSLQYIKIDENVYIQIDGNPYDSTHVESIEELNQVLNWLQEDISQLNKYVQDMPVLSSVVDFDMKRLCKKITLSNNVSMIKADEKNVYFSTWDALTHELAQWYISDGYTSENIEIHEGLSEYLGSVMFNSLKKKIAYDYLMEDSYFSQEKEKYEHIKPIDIDTLDLQLFYSLWATSMIKEEKDRRQSGQSLREGFLGRDAIISGLTYMECEDLVYFIIDKYGIEELFKLFETSEDAKALTEQYLEEWKDNRIKEFKN